MNLTKVALLQSFAEQQQPCSGHVTFLQVTAEDLKAALEEESAFVWDLTLPKKEDGMPSAFASCDHQAASLHYAPKSSQPLLIVTNGDWSHVGTLKGFGFATFLTRGHAESAIKLTNGKVGVS